MSNSGKVWDIREAYKQSMNNAWSRGDIGLGSSGNSTNGTINKVQISTTGNAVGFGDILTATTANGGAMTGSETRTLFGGGDQPSVSNVICYKEYSSDGNFADFGDLSVGRQILSGSGNGTRGIFAGGRTGIGPTVPSNVIDAVSYASLGNATDFGDLTVSRIGAAGGIQSPTRGVFAGGGNPANVIDFITFSSAGNATDFGDLTGVTSKNYFGGSSTEIKGVFGGGGAPGDPSTINILTIASAGNSEDFGDLTQSRVLMASASNGTRSVFFGGQQNVPGGPSSDVIDYITIATTGNATDFGDVSGASSFASGGTSNGHGGIVLGELQLSYVYYSPTGKPLNFKKGTVDRGVTGGGGDPSVLSSIDYVTISTTGNASDFGDLTVARQGAGGASNGAIGTFYSGSGPAGNISTIDFIQLASTGNAQDFGDTGSAREWNSSNCASDTKGIFGGGSPTNNLIETINFSTKGNPSDYGDLTVGRSQLQAVSNTTRGLFAGGNSGSDSNVVDYISMTSLGNATDFGDLSATAEGTMAGGNSTRAIFAGSFSPVRNFIDYFTIATTGNATDFGDLTSTRGGGGGTSNSTRTIFMGGRASDSAPYPGTNVIDYVTTATTGNATDYGDLTTGRRYMFNGLSDSHGGLS